MQPKVNITTSSPDPRYDARSKYSSLYLSLAPGNTSFSYATNVAATGNPVNYTVSNNGVREEIYTSTRAGNNIGFDNTTGGVRNGEVVRTTTTYQQPY